MATISHAVSTETIGFYGIPSFNFGTEIEDDGIKGTIQGASYLEQKVELLHQLGYPKVTEETFAGCTSVIQIDNRARSIMGL